MPANVLVGVISLVWCSELLLPVLIMEGAFLVRSGGFPKVMFLVSHLVPERRCDFGEHIIIAEVLIKPLFDLALPVTSQVY